MPQKSNCITLKQEACCQDKEDIFKQCDIFDFMANYVGLSVLHPGGYKVTDSLARALTINENTRVLDIACGKGTSAIRLAKKHGCSVVGVDLSETLLREAYVNAKRKGVAHKVRFQKADALNLPFKQGDFDAAMTQAVLVLIEDKVRAIKEAVRVIKPCGRAGWIELSWRQKPPKEFLKEVDEVICGYCMSHVRTYNGWEKRFKKAGIKNLKTYKYPFERNGILGMLKDEGLGNSVKIMLKQMTDSYLRNRMKTVDNFFKLYPQYFGYGIYIASK